jgi:methyl-accepting chemotaxis protein
MRWFNDLKIMKKFMVVGLMAGVLVGGSFVLFNVWTNSLVGQFKTFVDKEQAFAFALNEMYAQGLQSEQATRNVLINPSDENAKTNYLKANKNFDAAFETASRLVKEDADKIKVLTALKALWDEGDDLKRQIQNLATEGKGREATNLLIQQETPKWRDTKAVLLDLLAEVKKDMAGQRADVNQFTRHMIMRSIVLMVIVVSLVIAVLAFFGLSMKRMINALIERLSDIAQGAGDLSKRIPVASKCEFGEVGALFNRFVDKLHDIISEVAGNSTRVASAANEISLVAERMSTSTEEVTAQAATVATAGEEMAATSAEISQNCLKAAESSGQANDTALQGYNVVQQTLSVMNQISDCVKESAQTVDTLGMRSEQIGEIISTIEDIADQTNLLALNAAIEAARAGEQGRGFAVVADEVRALAERTTKATREISSMIKSIQQETRNAVTSMEQGVREVEAGAREATRSGEALEDILKRIGDVTMQVNQIATAAEEQTVTTSEISGNIHQMTDVLQEAAHGVHKTAAATNELSTLAEALEGLVSNFKL